MPCDSTTSIDRFLIRRKLTGSMDASLLQNGEFVYGDTEKSLFVKAPVGSNIYEYGRLNDTLSVNTHNVWSNQYTKSYIDDLISAIPTPVKSILLTAGGIAPTPSNGCSEPYISAEGDPPVFKVLSDFTGGSYGFWNISIPGDYTGNISKATILYSGPAESCQWSLTARVLEDNDDINIGGSWSSVYQFADTPENEDRLEKIELNGPINLFGSSSNQDNFACIRIQLESGTGTYKLLQVKLEY